MTPDGEEIIQHISNGKTEGFVAFAAMGIIVTLGLIEMWNEASKLREKLEERGRV